MPAEFVGFLLAGLSALCNGSFASLRKVEAVQRVSVTDIQFNLYLSLGVFISSICAILVIPLTGKDIGICWQGVVAGGLLAVAGLFSFLAVSHIGVSVAQGVWGGSSILVSFAWGAFGPVGVSGRVEYPFLCAVSILLILAGVAGIIASFRLSSSDETSPGEENYTRGDLVIGIALAMATGIAGGSILVPLSFAPESLQEIAFLPSFGIGVLLLAFMFDRGAAYCAPSEEYDYIDNLSVGVPLRCNAAVVYGMTSGMVWNVGNLCSIYAMKSGLSYGVAYPILQCALVFSGLWGILVFKEITGRKAISWFAVSACVVVLGAFLLGIFGPQKDSY